MINRDTILSSINKPEDRLFISKIIDRIEQTYRTGKIHHTDFLDPHRRAYVDKVLKRIDEMEFSFTGGYEGAERVIAIFRPAFVCDDSDAYEDFPLKFLRISISGGKKLSHRDYLGALLNLGIKREKIGDILVGDDFCDVVVMDEIAEYVCYNLDRVGNAKVTADIIDKNEIIVPDQKTREISATVASLRLDSVVSSGYGISRAKAAELIKAERVSINWEVTSSVTKPVREGDTISLRGKGRIQVVKIDGITRKGRTHIKIKQML